MFMSVIGGYGDSGISGMLYISSVVKTDLNWLFKVSAISGAVETLLVDVCNILIPVESCFWDFINHQKDFLLLSSFFKLSVKYLSCCCLKAFCTCFWMILYAFQSDGLLYFFARLYVRCFFLI